MEKITKDQFLEAIQKVKEYQLIIDTYKKQEEERVKKDRQEREKNCKHEYEYTNAKWRPVNEMRCINCGKIID